MNDAPHPTPDALDAFGRPLLILPNDEVTVALDGTERLILRTRDGNARHAVPLRHVRSITANPNVTFTGAALDACARRGITITFVDGRQKRRAFFFPTATKPLGLAVLLAFALDDPEWPERYGAWYENQRLGTLSRVALACGLLPDAALRRAPEVALEEAHRRKHGQSGHEWIAALREIVLTEFMADGSRWQNETVRLLYAFEHFVRETWT